MDDMVIAQKLKDFQCEIFDGCRTEEEARDVYRRFREFVSVNHLTEQQLEEFTKSGAGDMLYMMI